MILYFSATGNSKYVAEKIAEAIGDTAYSIEKLNPNITVNSGEIFGVISPTYAWELPSIVRSYLNHLHLTAEESPYTFFLATYGTTPGAAGAEAKKLLEKNGIKLSARYGVRMPDTWTPLFDLSNPEKVSLRNREADKELARVIHNIKNRKTGNMMHRSFPYHVRLISHLNYNRMRKTKNFRVEGSCIGCGLCAKKCPANAIQIENKKPVWVKERCIMCLRCLHHCPTFAIQYGNKTKSHGQYTHPEVKV